ncbi:hypothetical protein LTR56_005737 [Elasticomyces elasticus]|nr:hypothetical protein LTR56_005737 [Elasticomyces elasticus]KAK3657466.1 hypothetical protein LTR22_009332 [Elasticomyces elasticus]KAK4925667.1 hypothetical protein LTR49_007277 [Elasticomyces elasticus]KAK5764999.1 hypothetical protein LTS12_004777 [Elasticomyces elasticus]
MSYLITGASRGIGLELVKQLLALPEPQVTKVIALSRGAPPAALQELLDNHTARSTHVTASVDDTESVKQAAKAAEAELGDQGLDVLINNAGVFGEVFAEGARFIAPEEMLRVLDVNVVGPHRMTAAFLPLLEKGKQKKVINMFVKSHNYRPSIGCADVRRRSSTLGSIAMSEYFTFAPVPPYKISKAALHMLNKQYALEYEGKGFTFLAVSPGWLKTDLGGPHADLDVDVGVRDVMRIILEATPAQNGHAVGIKVSGNDRYDGKEVPW